MSGIQRDVFLYSKPSIHLRDFTVRTIFDERYEDAELYIAASVNLDAALTAYQVETMLYDADGTPVFAAPVSAAIKERTRMYLDEDERGCAKAHIPVARPRQWTAETPYRYTLVLTLRDADGRDGLGKLRGRFPPNRDQKSTGVTQWAATGGSRCQPARTPPGTRTRTDGGAICGARSSP